MDMPAMIHVQFEHNCGLDLPVWMNFQEFLQDWSQTIVMNYNILDTGYLFISHVYEYVHASVY